MRKQTRWLALVLVGACTSSASAQSPYMIPGPQPFAPYPQAMPYYPAPPMMSSPGYYSQPQMMPPAHYPQPRVMYVPATGAPWEHVPAPTQFVIVPRANPASAKVAPNGSGNGNNRLVAYETVEAAPQPAAKPVSAQTASHRHLAVPVEVLQACSGPDCGDPCDVPRACFRDENAKWLPKGRWNLQCLGGIYCDIGEASYNYALTTMRLGKVWPGDRCLSHLCGGFETLFEFNGASTFDSDLGNYFLGGSLITRYNFAQPGSRVVPYFQTGVGFQYNDAYKLADQTYLGSQVELTGQVQIGMRIFLTKLLSLDVEMGLQHISDQQMSGRNDGINALGGMAGLSYFFPGCRKR